MRSGVLAAVAVVACVAAGCGQSVEARPRSGDPDRPCAGPECKTPAEALAAAVAAYVDAQAEGDASAAWALVSSRCAELVDERRFRTTVAAYGVMFSRLAATDIELSIEGDRGYASYATGMEQVGPFVDQPWWREEGGWRWDAC